MAEVTYNGITLPWVSTEAAHQEVVYKDGDYVEARHDMTFDLLIARGTPGVFLSTAESLAAAIRRIRHALETPRRPFAFNVGGVAVLSADPTSDTNNGPLPEVIGITRLVGSESAAIRFRIVVHKRDCEGIGTLPPYLSHRWSESADIGEDFRTVYRRSGSMRIGSNATLNGQPVGSVDQFRYLVVPPIPFGFAVKHMHFQVSPDGLTLAYDVEYEEKDVGTMPPPPAVKAYGKSFVTASNNGATAYATAIVRLVGHPWSNKQALLATAIAVAMKCLERAGPAKGPPSQQWLLTGQISEELYKNEVEVQLHARLNLQDRSMVAVLTSGTGAFPPGPNTPGNPVGNEIGKQDGGDGGAARGNGGIRPGNGKPGPDAFTSPSLSSGKPPPPLFQPAGSNKPGGPPPNNGLMLPKALVPFGMGQPPLYSEPYRAKTPDPGLRATAGLRLISALINDPCVSLSELESQGNSLPGSFGELVASAPGGDLSRYFTGFVARSSAVTVAVVPDLEEMVAQQQRQLPKPPGAGYTDYRLYLEYSFESNRCALPQMTPNGTTSFVKLAADQVELKVWWSAERVGDIPAIPERENLGDDNIVFLRGGGSPGDVEFAPDGQTIIGRSSGWYLFGFKDPSKIKYGAGMVPWVTALCGGPPKPVIFGGPAFYQKVFQNPDTETSDLTAGATGVPANQAGDFIPEWPAIWAGFLGTVDDL